MEEFGDDGQIISFISEVMKFVLKLIVIMTMQLCKEGKDHYVVDFHLCVCEMYAFECELFLNKPI